MIYYKSVDNGVIVGINTVNTDGDGNITETEYEIIRQMIIETPEGKCIYDNGDGTYEYIDAQPVSDSEPLEEEFAQAGRILMGME